MSKKKQNVDHLFLKRSLIISCSVNIVLLSVVFYTFFREINPAAYCTLKLAQSNEYLSTLDKTNVDIINEFSRLTFDQLLPKLENDQLIENGYSTRDLALGSLVSFYYFDISKALTGNYNQIQKRKINLDVGKNESVEFHLFPGLSDQDFKSIIQFAKNEEWPFTSKGLFLLLPKMENLSLAEAFYLTQEFIAVEHLFNRSDKIVEKHAILKMLLEGDWDTLYSFVESQKQAQDLSEGKRQWLLLEYIAKGSRTAAHLILQTDFQNATRKLSDNQIISILKVLDEKNELTEKFAITALTSPRGDKVWQTAAERLYQYAGEEKPQKWQYEIALHRFAPNIKELFPQQVAEQITSRQLAQKIVVETPRIESPKVVKIEQKKVEVKKIDPPKIAQKQLEKKAIAKKMHYYIVKEGDSLWKISRNYKVDIKTIKSCNQLSSDFLKPGTILKIPCS